MYKVWPGLLAVAVLGLVAVSSSGAGPRTCFGSQATITASSTGPTLGTSGRDVIIGTSADDEIRGRGGSDKICSQDGDDVVYGGPGADRINLGAGHDLARGGTGNDLIQGAKGSDVIYGNSGRDTLMGGSAADQLFGGRDADTLQGKSGPDALEGGPGPDLCSGGKGDDELSRCNDLNCVHHVAPGGSDSAAGTAQAPWATVTHAVEAAADAHCTIVVADGVYRETVDIDRRFASSLTILAANRHGAVFQAAKEVINIDGAKNVTLDGFEIRHVPGADGVVVSISGSGNTFSKGIMLVNSIVHDSYDDDLIKINAGVRDSIVANTITYNPGRKGQHYDLNGVEDMTLQNNIMFNDYAGSGRAIPVSKMFVIIKDSNTSGLDIGGSKRITVDGNVMIGWSIGGADEAMLKVGNDGKPYYEALDVVIENNLFLSNGPDVARSVFGAAGVRDVVFRNNTVNHATAQYQYRFEVKDRNPRNENITLCNNIWSSNMDDFGKTTGPIVGLVEQSNLYWNGGAAVPDFDPSKGVIADPDLSWNRVALPRTGSADAWLTALVADHGTPNGAVVDAADPSCSSDHDILGQPRGDRPDIGAVELAG